MKKIEFEELKPGTVFKRKRSRILFMASNIGDAQTLTGKNKGNICYPDDNELITPVKVKIAEVK